MDAPVIRTRGNARPAGGRAVRISAPHPPVTEGPQRPGRSVGRPAVDLRTLLFCFVLFCCCVLFSACRLPVAGCRLR